MEIYKIVILGGGMTAGYCVKELGKIGVGAGEVCLISADNVPPYKRPDLSKYFLADEEPAEKIFINKESFYEEKGIHLRLNTTATALDPEAHHVRLGAEEIGFEKLVLATGSRPRRLELPGAELEGIFTLRSYADCLRLKEAAAQAQHIVIIGGGFIGTEVAARFSQRGWNVTMLYREQRLLDFFFPPEISAAYEARYQEHNVRLLPSTTPSEFIGQNGRLKGIKLDSGEILPADMALVAVGAIANVELAEAPGLQIERFVVTDEFLQTSHPDIYAGGDVIIFPERYSATKRHIEHEEHARVSGRHIARALQGEKQPYDYLPMVWSDVYDLSWEFRGSTQGAEQIVYRGDVMSGQFSAFWLKEGVVIGALTPYSQDTTLAEAAAALIKERKRVDPAALQNENMPL